MGKKLFLTEEHPRFEVTLTVYATFTFQFAFSQTIRSNVTNFPETISDADVKNTFYRDFTLFFSFHRTQKLFPIFGITFSKFWIASSRLGIPYYVSRLFRIPTESAIVFNTSTLTSVIVCESRFCNLEYLLRFEKTSCGIFGVRCTAEDVR